jgi:CHAT domain-containing protein/tetratricopeptide (TPR) repeat protein
MMRKSTSRVIYGFVLGALGNLSAFDSQLAEMLHNSSVALARGDLKSASQLYEATYRQATKTGDQRIAGRSLSGLATVKFSSLLYKDALVDYLRARQLSQRANDRESLGSIASNLSSLYNQMGDIPSALESARQAEETTPKEVAVKMRGRWLLHTASLYALQKDTPTAERLYSEGVNAADAQGDTALAAQGWTLLGLQYVTSGDLRNADICLTEGFRLRRMLKSPEIAVNYRGLGQLRLAQGDPESAVRLLSAAIGIAGEHKLRTSPFQIYYQRALAFSALGRNAAALRDFETATRVGKQWRSEIVPETAARVFSDMHLQTIYSGYIQAGMQLYRETGDQAIARKMFFVAEENRASTLREQLLSGKKVTPEYWRTLAELRLEEISSLNQNAPLGNRLRSLRLRMTELESQAGIDVISVPEWNSHRKMERNSWASPLPLFQKTLLSSEAVLSFHLGERKSYLWVVTNNSFYVYELAPKAQIAAAVDQFLEAILTGSPQSGTLGSELYNQLFSQLASSIRNRQNWLLVLDDALFRLPLAALSTPEGQYLVERHSLRTLPAAVMLLDREKAVAPEPPGPFVGVGDPIYNTADSRWTGSARLALVRAPHQASGRELARLPGSAREVKSCATLWPSQTQSIILTGGDVERARLEAALSYGPGVLHFATHVIEHPKSAGEYWIALGLNRSGTADFLTPGEIAAHRYRLGLVVLNGCSSGQGKAVSGAGLMGLTRSWLISGAQAVTASHWTVPDDTGTLFTAFYGFLGRHNRAISPELTAKALQSAQIGALRSRTWRSQPRYWAAYFMVGKD